MDFETQVEKFFQSGSALSWIAALAIAFIATLIIQVVLKYILKKAETFSYHTKVSWDNIVIDCLKKTKVWGIFAATLIPMVNIMSHSEGTNKTVYAISTVLIALQVIIWGLTGIKYWRNNYLVRRLAEDASSGEALGLMATISKAIFIIIVILIVLSNLGVNISALIAGLGIGGIAIALAAQNLLGDLIGSLAIVLDKPFVIGDSIVVGDKSGTVHDIGIKTTRLISTSGEELIMSNKDLLESRIHNYKRLQRRRIEKVILVTLDTPKEKLEMIPSWLEAAVKKQPKFTFDRSTLDDITQVGIAFRYVYFVEDPDYNTFAGMQQNLFLEVIGLLQKNEIKLAHQ